MLLRLPPELIQLVLKNVDTPDYLQVAHSCHVLYELASSCREVVLHHLYRTPGLNQDLQEQETKRLFQLLARRARQQLYGAQFNASCKVLGLGDAVIDVQASSIASSGPANIALAFKGIEGVFIFQASDEQEDPVFLIQTKLPWGHFGPAEVLKTAPLTDFGHGFFALYRFTAGVDGDDPNAEHPFVRDAQQSNPNGTVFLIHYPLDIDFSRPCIRVCSFPDHADYEPLAIAVASSDTFVISWRHKSDAYENEVVMYQVYREEEEEELGDSTVIKEVIYECCFLVDSETSASDRIQNGTQLLDGGYLNHEQGPVKDLAFNDSYSQILYYHGAQTLYGSFQRLDMSAFPDSLELNLYRNACVVPFSDSLSLHFAIDIPFFGTHDMLMHNNMEMCNWKYLSLGIGKHRTENWSVACLLRSEAFCRSRNCTHELNLDRGRRFTDWTVVAILSGFHESTSSIGSIATKSPGGTRIAVANWDAIYIWALEPASLIRDNEDGYYPPCSQAENPNVVELQPVALPLDAVCFKLRFLENENKLLALTDRGLMHWDLGPLCKGERRAVELSLQ